MENKTKKTLTKVEERFGVFFEYNGQKPSFNVYRLNADKDGKSDLLYDEDLFEPLTKSQFEDECVCWCDRNAA